MKSYKRRGILNSSLHKFSRNFLDRYELFKLKKLVCYSYDNSPFYHKLFKEKNLKPNDIKLYSDLTKIPYTTPEDLQNSPKSFFSVSENNFINVLTTAGSTGKPKKAYFTKEDNEKIVRSIAIGGKLLYGISQKDVIRFTFEVGYGTEIWGTRYYFDRAYGEVIGAMMLSTGRLSIKDELAIINEYKPNIFGDVTSRISYLTSEMKKICDLSSLGIQTIFIGAEPTPDLLRKNIEKSWNASAVIGYGINEVGPLIAGECEKKCGMHLNELSYLLEVVDPKSGEHLEDGEIGELIYTTLDRKGMPLLRYNSHDLGRILSEDCLCGLPLKRIEIHGRTDDLVPIGTGDNLFTRIFDDILFSYPEIVDYQIVFDRSNGIDQISVIAESQKINKSIQENILQKIIKISMIKNGINVSKTIAKPIVKLVKPNSLERDSIKIKRVVDNRGLYN
jgi:phenylacetate-CoA ligase